MAAGNQKQPWTTHDLACTYCREKKIRCGRERPQCGSCKRDGLSCGYSIPRKRVNHIKLLCQSVSGLEDRLSNIERGLLRLTSRFIEDDTVDQEFCVNKSRNTWNENLGQPGVEACISQPDETEHDDKRQSRGVICGPYTLFNLCKDFCDTVVSCNLSKQENLHVLGQSAKSNFLEALQIPDSDLLSRHLDSLCREASIQNGIAWLEDANRSVALPPKPFLLIMQSQFFQSLDYSTDIFTQSHVANEIERIYGQQVVDSDDEAWAICFNVIILLMVGGVNSNDSVDGLDGGLFVQPFLSAVHAGVNNARILTLPRLINVQAVTLLAVAARRLCHPELAERLFAQACVLLRTTALRLAVFGDNNSTTEMDKEELSKLAASLYVQDKHLATLTGSQCWFREIDCRMLPNCQSPLNTPGELPPEIQLARIQEEIYDVCNNFRSQNLSHIEYEVSLSRIGQKLSAWATNYDILVPPSLGDTDICLQLRFFATRLAAFYVCDDESSLERSLNDSRASCILVLYSFGQSDEALLSWLERILMSMDPVKSLQRSFSSTRTFPPNRNPTVSNTANFCGYHAHKIIDSFSVAGFVLLAKNITRSRVMDPRDLALLRKTAFCIQEYSIDEPCGAYSDKVDSCFQKILKAIDLIITPSIALSPANSADFSLFTPKEISENNSTMESGRAISTIHQCAASSLGHAHLDVFQPPFQHSQPLSIAMPGTEASSSKESPQLLTPTGDRSINYPPLDFSRLFSSLINSSTEHVSPGSLKRRQFDEEAYSNTHSEPWLFDFMNVEGGVSFEHTSLNKLC